MKKGKWLILLVAVVLFVLIFAAMTVTITTVGEVTAQSGDRLLVTIVGDESYQNSSYYRSKPGIVYIGQEIWIPYDEVLFGFPEKFRIGDTVDICYFMYVVPSPNTPATLGNVVYVKEH